MKLKIIPKILIDAAVPTKNSNDLEFSDLNLLSNYDGPLFSFLEKTQHSTLSSSFTQEELFYYKVERYADAGVKDIYEIGIGRIVDNDKKKLLRREIAMFNGTGSDKGILSSNGFISFNGKTGGILCVSQYIPATIQELSYIPNSILSSAGNFMPSTVEIEEHSVAGRKDGELTSIPISEVINSETDFIKFSGKSSKKSGKGCLRYNNKTNKLEFHNGKGWQQIACE